jgi:hypothetical protein
MTQKKLEIIGPYTPEHEGPFCTRDGKPVRIICTDRKSRATPKCMIVALVDDGDQELNLAFEKDGRHCTGGTNYDLMNAREVPVAREFWIVDYGSGKTQIHNSLSGAVMEKTERASIIHVREVLPGEGA